MVLSYWNGWSKGVEYSESTAIEKRCSYSVSKERDPVNSDIAMQST